MPAESASNESRLILGLRPGDLPGPAGVRLSLPTRSANAGAWAQLRRQWPGPKLETAIDAERRCGHRDEHGSRRGLYCLVWSSSLRWVGFCTVPIWKVSQLAQAQPARAQAVTSNWHSLRAPGPGPGGQWTFAWNVLPMPVSAAFPAVAADSNFTPCGIYSFTHL